MKLGLLWPADGRNDAEFWRWLPRGADLLIARYDVGGTLDLAQLEADAGIDAIRGAARLLRHAKPLAVGLGDCAGSFIGGRGADIAQAEAVSEMLGVPAITMSTAIVEAAQALRLKRVAVLSPYEEAVTARFAAYLEAYGFKVVASRSVKLGDEQAIDAMTPTAWQSLVMEADHAEANGLLIAGGGLSLAAIVTGLEARLSKPVICGPGALMWSLLTKAGLDPAVADRGRLFGASHEPEPLKVLARHLSRATKTYAVSDAPPIFASGAGARLVTAEGKEFLDFACGSGTTSLGHNHPRVMAAVRAMLDRGVTHVGPHFHTEAQVKLYARLAESLPPELRRFQPATNGTEATDIALKAVMHFTGARKFMAFEGSYHGRGFGALAVSSPRARGINAELGPFAPDAAFLPFNAGEKEITEALAAGGFAGIIVEPVQATQGVILPKPGFLARLRHAADAARVPLIFDEVFTGYGRTGSLFYFEQAGVVPDLLILAKAFGGGFPAALVAGRDGILTHWTPGTQSSTFQLHPVAAAASLAVLDTIETEQLLNAARRVGTKLSAETARLRRHSCVKDIHGIGAMFGIEIADVSGAPDQRRTKAIRRAALENGLITWECGSAGHVIGLVPPLIVSRDDIIRAVDILDRAMTSTQ